MQMWLLMVLLFVDYFIEMDLLAKRSFRLLNRGALRFMADIFSYNKDMFVFIHRRRNMLKVEGAIDIIAHEKMTMPTCRSNHAHCCINEAVGLGRQAKISWP